jgi:hypothetical protein
MNVMELAQIGYEAYGNEAKWKNYAGKPMPSWLEVPQHIKDKWAVAAEAIADTVRKMPT